MIWQQKIWLYGALYKSTIMILLYGLYEGEIREQQKTLLPWVLLRKYGLILSHDLRDVAGVGDGTIMVHKGYSLALEDREVLPLWKESTLGDW